MTIHEFLLKAVITAIASLEGIKIKKPFLKKLIDSLTPAEKRRFKPFFDRYYHHPYYSNLILLFSQLIPIVIAEGVKLKKYQRFVQHKVGNEKLKEMIRLILKWDELSPEIYPLVSYSGGEITTRADDRAEPREIAQSLRTLFPDTVLNEMNNYSAMKKNLDATVLIVRKKLVEDYGDDHYIIKADPLFKKRKKGRRLGVNSTFSQQPSATSRGTGFFIKKYPNEENKFLATAAHVLRVNGKPLSPKRFLYIQDFELGLPTIERVNSKGKKEQWVIISKTKVYRAKPKKVGEGYNGDNLDWVLLEMKANEITNSYPEDYIELSKRDSKTFPVNDPQNPSYVYGIGHGLGLPKKFHFDSRITANDPKKNYFKCCLDFFSGNSGSPIFDATTHEAIGILSRGKEDFNARGSFIELTTRKCEPGIGEQCQRIELLPFGSSFNRTRQKTLAASLGIEPKRFNAPYLYLAKEEGTQNYLLYVLVPHQARTTFELHDEFQDSLVTRIVYHKKRENNLAEGFFHSVHRLAPINNPAPAERTVEVKVKFGEDEDFFKGFLRFDEGDVDNEFVYDPDKPVVYNAPYIYLTKPEEDNEEEDYSPRVIVPVKGFNEHEEENVLEPDDHSNRITTINLVTPSGTEDVVYISSFQTNNEIYNDEATEDDDGFVVDVNFNSDGVDNEKRKAKIRNANADEKPTPFDG